MASNLKFQGSYTPSNPSNLKFGASLIGDDAELSGYGLLPPPVGPTLFKTPALLSGFALLSPPTSSAVLAFDNAVSRGPRHEHAAPWERGARVVESKLAAHQDGARLIRHVAGSYAEAGALSMRVVALFQEMQNRHRSRDAAWREGGDLAHQRRTAWQEGSRKPISLPMPYREGDLRATGVLTRFQHGSPVRPALQLLWEEARAQSAALQAPYRPLGDRRIHRSRIVWQEGMAPPPGQSDISEPPGPQPPAPPVPCYTPPDGDEVLLRFSQPPGTPQIVFICRHTNLPPAVVVVPIRRYYVTINDIQLRRIDGNLPIPTYTFSMEIDRQSWTWSFSASVPKEAKAQLGEVMNGELVELEALINGVPYRLLAEGIGSDRKFASTRIRVRGRGIAAVLDEATSGILTFGNAMDRTAAQLMDDVLQVNGVGIGWAVDWQLDDWLVPAGAWSHQGSYISALTAIAGAAGGYLQPHATARTLRVLPHYALPPWEWDDLVPDYELPAAVTTQEGIEWATKPRYNRVFVRGQHMGVLGQVTRAGTAGDILAPTVTDALLTHVVAARQRGTAILSDTGPQADVTLRLPILPETGIIVPGKTVRRVDGSDIIKGIVRSTVIEWSRPTLRQVIGVQTHV